MFKTRTDKNKYGFFLFSCAAFLSFIVFIINLLRCNMDTDWLSWVYFIPSALGHAALFALVPCLFFYLPFSYIFKDHRVPAIIFTVFAIAMQTVLILNGFVFSLYRFHINGFVIELALKAGNEVFLFDTTLYLKFALLVVFAAVAPYVLILRTAERWSARLHRKQIATVSILLITCLLFSHVGHAVASACRQTSIQKSATALPYFFPLTMNKLLDRLGITSPDAIDSLDRDVPASDIAYPLHPIIAGDSIPRYNILLIAIDSWNPRSFDSITTPNIYRFASQNQYFANHNGVGYGTRENLFGIFFGLSFTYEKDFVTAKKSPLLLDQLVNRNYAIQVFPSGPLPNPPFHEILFRKAPHVHSNTEGDSPFERDRNITRLAIDFMNEQKNSGKPFFNFVFYDLPHAIALPKEYLQPQFEPSWTVADYMKLNNNMDPAPFFNLYRNCVYQCDLQAGILLEYVQNAGLTDNTVIIITGDHSQEFNENRKNYWGHNGNFTQWQIHIPFVLYYPGIEQAKPFTHFTSHYDIAPTLMKRFLAVENPAADFSMGYDIYDTINRYPHVVGDYVNYGFIFEDMIIRTNHLGSMTVTDKALNDLPRSAVNVKELQKAIEKKNMFFKR